MLSCLDPDAVADEYERRGLDRCSDAELFELAARVVGLPKAVAADSFRLHAPLELLARRALLGYVDPARREAARRRIVWVAATYARSAPDADEPDTGEPDTGEPDTGEPDTGTTPVDEIVASLAAAGHASIYRYLLPRVAPRSPAAVALARPLGRELARNPDWKVEWVDTRPPRGAGDAAALTGALLATPRLGLPGSDFIYPLVHQVDERGVAAELLGPVVGAALPFAEAARALGRVAAWSMLQDDPAYAPYGWTHCLTIPQAVAGIAPTTADPVRTLAIAATYVTAFRAALSNHTVVAAYEPEPARVGALEALDAPPALAAAAVHHAPATELGAIATELATRAALHADAHFAKYTLGCFDAAHADPDRRRLFLSAAAYLAAWWGEAGRGQPAVNT